MLGFVQESLAGLEKSQGSLAGRVAQMLELTGVADLLRGVAFLYWLVAVICLFFALYKPRKWTHKSLWATLVVVLFSYVPLTGYMEEQLRIKQHAQFREEANAHFGKLCRENSREFIKRKVEGVDGLLLLRPRTMASHKDFQNQYWMGDPYGYDLDSGTTRESLRHIFGYLEVYSFVEERIETRPNEYKFARYSVDPVQGFRAPVVVESVSAPSAAYGLEWEDVSTMLDRKYWIAGGKARIMDLASYEVIAEHVGYIGDPQFGSAGNRNPWADARRFGAGYCRGNTVSGSNLAFAQRVLISNKK